MHAWSRVCGQESTQNSQVSIAGRATKFPRPCFWCSCQTSYVVVHGQPTQSLLLRPVGMRSEVGRASASARSWPATLAAHLGSQLSGTRIVAFPSLPRSGETYMQWMWPTEWSCVSLWSAGCIHSAKCCTCTLSTLKQIIHAKRVQCGQCSSGKRCER